jgi:hypothetical protein
MLVLFREWIGFEGNTYGIGIYGSRSSMLSFWQLILFI